MKGFLVGQDLDPSFLQFICTFPEEVRKINGILNIDPFNLAEEYYQTEVVADMSIDPNANVSGKSPVNFDSEIFKPMKKLRSMHTAWTLIKEKWGEETAKECLGACLNGKLYHHDWTKYDVPYTYGPKELVTIKTHRGVEKVPYDLLYEMYEKTTKTYSKPDGATVIRPDNVLILDRGEWVKLKAITKKPLSVPMVMIRLSDGRSQFITCNHPVITLNKGEINACDVEIGDKIETFCPEFEDKYDELNLAEEFILNNCHFGFKLDDNKLEDLAPGYLVNEYLPRGKQINCAGGNGVSNRLLLTEDFGYIVGMFVAEGNYVKNGLALKQKEGVVSDKIKSAFESCGINYSFDEENGLYRINSKVYNTLFKDVFMLGSTSQHKRLPKCYQEYGVEFLSGIVAGIVDGDGTVSPDSQNVVIRVTSRTMLLQVQDILYFLGHKSNFVALEGVGSEREYNGKTITQRLPLYKLHFVIGEDEDVNVPSVKMVGKRKVKPVHNSIQVVLDDPGKVEVVDVAYLTEDCVPDGFIYDVTTETGTLDCNNIHSHNCFAPDSSFWMHEGRPYGWLPGGKPNKLRSYIGQTIEVAMDMSQEHAGAIGIANVLVNAAYYTYLDKIQIKKSAEILENLANNFTDEDNYYIFRGEVIKVLVGLYSHNEEEFEKKLDVALKYDSFFYDVLVRLYEKEVEDELQQLIHVLHNTFRIGGDSPFTNLSLFCRETIRKFFQNAVYPNGLKPEEIIDEIMRIQLIFARFFSKGSPITGKNYRFPVCTANFAVKNPEEMTEEEKASGKKFIVKDKEFLRELGRLNAKRGVFNFHRGEKIASCCRLTSDLSELMENIKFDSFGNGGMSIGAHRVVALNLHSIMCEAVDKEISFFTLLDYYQGLAEKLLIVHKEWIKFIISTGTLKFFRINWEHIDMFFSTFGFTGLYDAFEQEKFFLLNPDYKGFAQKTLIQMNDYAKIAGKQKEGFAFNVEEVPAENASPKLAMLDNFYYGSKSWYKPVKLLSNQMIPLYEDKYGMFERLNMMGELMDLASGGAICHFNVDGSMKEEASVRLTEMLFEEFGLVHFAIEIGSTTCVNGHTFPGIFEKCPECGGEIKTWTRRVVGFNSDTADWHSIRKEWDNLRRVRYKVSDLK